METPFAIIISQGSFETSKVDNRKLGVAGVSGHEITPLQKGQQSFESSIGCCIFHCGDISYITHKYTITHQLNINCQKCHSVN